MILGLDDLVADRDPGGGSGLGGAGTDTGSGASAGTGACEGVCGTPGCGTCPPLSETTVPAAAGAFVMDTYEITNAEYQAFLAAGPSLALAPMPDCAENHSFEPNDPTEIGLLPSDLPGIAETCGNWKMFDADPDKPVACVDWCDASAYCAWAGKRLCGRFGGADYDVTNGEAAGLHDDPAVSEWFAACSQDGANEYPYGAAYEAGRCNDLAGGPEAVGSFPSCVGGFPDLFDLSGNVDEWDNACTDYNNPEYEQNCLARGGPNYGSAADLRCANFRDTRRYNQSDGIGFRCCRDAG